MLGQDGTLGNVLILETGTHTVHERLQRHLESFDKLQILGHAAHCLSTLHNNGFV